MGASSYCGSGSSLLARRQVAHMPTSGLMAFPKAFPIQIYENGSVWMLVSDNACSFQRQLYEENLPNTGIFTEVCLSTGTTL